MKERWQRLALIGAIFLATPFQSSLPLPAAFASTTQAKTKDGVAIAYRKQGGVEYVVGSIVIHEPVSNIWTVLANPYEFEEKISPRFQTVAVLADSEDRSLLKCRVDMGPIFPAINYTVESRYDPGRSIRFRSIAGDLKDFRGIWTVTPSGSGQECAVSYSLYVVPGFPVPQWLIRQAVKVELPHTLLSLRRRIEEIYDLKQPRVKRSIAAASAVSHM